MELNPSDVESILETRYLSVAGLTVLLWDHFITFETERRLIWPSRSTYVKWAFLCTRYLVPIILVINAHLSAQRTSLINCKPWFVLTFILGVTSLSVGNSLILIKIWKLWDGKKDIISGTIIVFGLTVCGLVTFIGLLLAESLSSVHYSPVLRMCGLTRKPRWLKAVWALSSGFDAFVFAMVWLNALSRPRGSQTPLVKVLYRDGMFFFFAISALGWFNLVLAIVAPVFKIVLGVFCIWALSVTIVSRMIMNLQAAELMMTESPDGSVKSFVQEGHPLGSLKNISPRELELPHIQHGFQGSMKA